MKTIRRCEDCNYRSFILNDNKDKLNCRKCGGLFKIIGTEETSQETNKESLIKFEQVKTKKVPVEIELKRKDGTTAILKATKIVKDTSKNNKANVEVNNG